MNARNEPIKPSVAICSSNVVMKAYGKLVIIYYQHTIDVELQKKSPPIQQYDEVCCDQDIHRQQRRRELAPFVEN
jgi:hypothetical protein